MMTMVKITTKPIAAITPSNWVGRGREIDRYIDRERKREREREKSKSA